MAKAFYEPLSAADAWFLYAERPETPLDLGTVYVFEGGSRVPGGRGALGIEQTVIERLHLVPRYRQKIHPVRFHLGHPVWVDDADFDIHNHVRYETLPPPGDGASVRDGVARIMARPLDMRRPLWDMTIVTGLRGDRVVVVNRTHHAMVDGVSAADIITVLMDLEPQGTPVEPPAEAWQPRPAPTNWELLKPVLWNPPPRHADGDRNIRRRWAFWRLPYSGFMSVGKNAVRSAPDLFFNRPLGLQRSGRGVKVPLDQFKALKAKTGSTVNDGVLATVAEALHRYLTDRQQDTGEEPPERVRVFCPVSVRADDAHGQLGNQVSGMIMDLPTGDISLEARLEVIKDSTVHLKKSRQAIAASSIAGLAGWAPPTLLVLAGRVMPNQQGGANINVTNVPGPQFPLYAGGAQLLEVWPFAPLYPSMGLGIAVVSYNGNVYFGISADAGLVPDVDVFAGHLRQAATEVTNMAVAPSLDEELL
ncbi:MAG TPA: wax ester/triacylglycerol synthase family O-acyltransferase [Candidatus Dormibacteraeota bacterium]|nr:wax ester/triacylglycerol synthase family O-acyltransferase [Candidatus Dormibacteraeota bacterium]